jgi:hypothetical protein
MIAALVAGGDVHSQQPAKEKKEPDEAFVLKLEPFIVAAIKPDPNDTPLRKLQKERCRERAIALAKIRDAIAVGKWDPRDFEESLSVPVVLTENLLEHIEKPADQLKCHELRLDFLKYIEKVMDTRVLIGIEAPQTRDIAKAARIAAEIDLLKFKARTEKPMK